MEESGKKKVNKIKTFSVPIAYGENQVDSSITKTLKEEIINKALNYHSQGNFLEAIKYYQKFIKQGFIDNRVFSNYGLILQSLGKFKQSEKYYRKAISCKPDYPEAHLNLGSILTDLGNLREAELFTRKAIELKPNFAEAYANLGNILRDLDNLKEAELFTRKAIELKPNFAEAYANLGNILRDLDNLKEAELFTRKAIELKPNFAEAYANLGNILRDLDNLKEAELFTRKAIEMKPDYPQAYFNLGLILRDFGHIQEAELFTRKAIQLKPDYPEAYFNLSWIQLLRGEYQSGLENYEFRFKTKKPAITHANIIPNQLNNKKFQKGEQLLIVSEQGLGDTLQYMRYIPYLRKQGFDVSFCAQEKLHSLIKASDISSDPVTPQQANAVSEGQWIPLLSLPRYLRVNPKNPIISERYIYPTNKHKKKWKDILSREKKPIIGINWQGNPNVEKKDLQGRSLPLETFSTLTGNNNFNFLSLQKGFGSEQLNHCSFKNKFVKCQPIVDKTWDFLENAAIIENCDLIITSDTSIAHLAGGMGKSTWLLLKHIPEWRWGLEGETTFWYPSMRLFRQKERHNWEEVMERISDQINTKYKTIIINQ